MESFTLGLMRGDGAPLYRQLYRHIVEEIASGGLAAGEKLPSKRRLAADLRVSVSTVETAYQMLVAEGYIGARAKSGFTVCRIEKLDAPVRPAPAAPPEPPAKRWAYDFGTGSVDTALFPFKTWARIQRETVTAHPELLNHGSRQGDASLRAAIAKYLHAYRGVVCAPEQIVVGAGIEYLVGLLARLFCASTFAVENPGYPRTAQQRRAHGVRACGRGRHDAGRSAGRRRAACVCHAQPPVPHGRNDAHCPTHGTAALGGRGPGTLCGGG